MRRTRSIGCATGSSCRKRQRPACGSMLESPRSAAFASRPPACRPWCIYQLRDAVDRLAVARRFAGARACRAAGRSRAQAVRRRAQPPAVRSDSRARSASCAKPNATVADVRTKLAERAAGTRRATVLVEVLPPPGAAAPAIHAMQAELAATETDLLRPRASVSRRSSARATPEFPGVSLEARRAINLAAIAYAHVIMTRLAPTGLHRARDRADVPQRTAVQSRRARRRRRSPRRSR